MASRISDMIEAEVDAFIIDRRAGNLSKNTIDFYISQLKYLSRFCHEKQYTYMHELQPTQIREMFVLMSGTHNKGGVHALYRTLKVFFNWYEKEIDDPTYRNPIKKIVAPKRNTDVIEGVSQDDFLALISTCGKTYYGQRDKAIMMFMYDSGIRVTELCDLNVGDLDKKTGSVLVRHGKGDKARTVFAGTKTLKEIIRYLRQRTDLDLDAPLFTHKSGSRFDREGISSILTRAAKEAHIKNAPSPHDFRRAFATQSLRNGANLRAVRDQLGHTTYAIVDRYASLNTKDIRDQHEASSPIDRMKKAS